jgi:hypothetical protein
MEINNVEMNKMHNREDKILEQLKNYLLGSSNYYV